MSQPVIVLWASLLLLAGCATAPEPVPAPPPALPTHLTVGSSEVVIWLQLQEEVGNLSKQEATELLIDMAEPVGGRSLYYYGLLNQQSGKLEGWVRARDVFRTLGDDAEVVTELRQLARILESANQVRINSAVRHQQVARQLQETDLEKDQLEQKIQALTEVEAIISTRKEQ